MTERVLDASVLIALLRDEPLRAGTQELVAGAVMSTVNLAEVLSKADELGVRHSPELAHLISLLARIDPFTTEQCRVAADLRMITRSLGLSLGDRACLALALVLDFEVIPADRIWAKLDLGLKITVVR